MELVSVALKAQRVGCEVWPSHRYRYAEREGCPMPGAAARDEVTAHSTRQLPADRETETDAFGSAGMPRADLHERLKDHFQLSGLDADSGVRHLHECGDARAGGHAVCHRDAAARRRELDGVGQHVEQDLLQLLA